ncbi:MAG: DUF4175 domain-containing protein [Rhodospirillaceae bacterium]|nr:DUF4175 domain-containing protein [Rhodospirillaceae bacterium]
MANHKTILMLSGIVLSLLAFQVSAAEPAKQPSAMMRGMNDHMGEMEKRMANMHQMMERCMKDEPSCPMDKMMTDMQDMHARMEKMMYDMKTMHGSQPPQKK